MFDSTRKPVLILAALILSVSFIFVNRISKAQGDEMRGSTQSFEIYMPAVYKHFSYDPSSWWQENWAMVAANPQRTSHVPNTDSNQTEIPGDLQPLWYRPIYPYINYKTQVIAANDLLYISTARGLYAIHTGDRAGTTAGDLSWVYPTELPLGNSPTVAGDVIYVGGFDKRMHAIQSNPHPSGLPTDSTTGYKINNQVLWTFEAGAGFEANPLVVKNTVYAGNRDGYFYAIDATNGTLKWRYQTAGTILQSAAYQDNTIYFVSNDMHAYAVNATSGSLVWRSEKLGGGGFYSYWPVIYNRPGTSESYIIFVGSTHYYRNEQWMLDRWPDIGTEFYLHGELGAAAPSGLSGNPLDATPILQYREAMPWRRTYFVLNRSNGQEFTMDLDNDGQPEYAPILYQGAKGGMRYPPIIGGAGGLYQAMPYTFTPVPNQGHILEWDFGTQNLAPIHPELRNAADEPLAYSSGGNMVYFTLTVDRFAGSALLNTVQTWDYWSYNLATLVPGYNERYCGGLPPPDTGDYLNAFDNRTGGSCNENGVYSQHGAINPLIPYKDRVYVLRGNSIIAFSNTANAPNSLSTLDTVTTQQAPPQITSDQLKQKLETEVQKIINTGHLLPGYHIGGTWNETTNPVWDTITPPAGVGDYLAHYFHNPADTLYTLISALPHLSPTLQGQTRDYLQQEFADYPPYEVAHIGWQDGTPRQSFDPPPEMQEKMDNFLPRPDSRGTETWLEARWWTFPPDSFYALWRYAQEFGGAADILNQIRTRNLLDTTPPNDSFLSEYPWVTNAYIAGYLGYLELQDLAGETRDSDVEAELTRLMSLRVSQFSLDSPWSGRDYRRGMNVSRNFMYLVPELGEYLQANALSQVQSALDEYNDIAPGWFVSFYDATFGEGYFNHLYDTHSLFQAHAQILGASREELIKYLDAPAFERGDLFYIQNLVAAIEAPGVSTLTHTDTNTCDDTNSIPLTTKFENFINHSGNMFPITPFTSQQKQ